MKRKEMLRSKLLGQLTNFYMNGKSGKNIVSMLNLFNLITFLWLGQRIYLFSGNTDKMFRNKGLRYMDLTSNDSGKKNDIHVYMYVQAYMCAYKHIKRERIYK